MYPARSHRTEFVFTYRVAHIYTKASAMETDKDTAAELYSPRRHADGDTLYRAYLCRTPANRHGEKTEMQPLHLFATSSSFFPVRMAPRVQPSAARQQ